MLRKRIFGVGIFSIALATVALAADRSPVPAGQPIIQVAPEQSVEGLTIEEHFAARDQKHAMLTLEMPAGASTQGINVKLTRDEILELRNVMPVSGEPLRIGTVKRIPSALVVTGIYPKAGDTRVAGGALQYTADGGFSWGVSVGSKGAHAIRIHLSNFSLPANAEMYFFDAAGEAYGPYTGLGRNDTGEFWTDSVRSDKGIIMIRQLGPGTPNELGGISFTIDKVAHIGNGFPRPNPQAEWTDGDRCGWNGNPSCVEDANCGSVAPADQSAIAKIEWIAGCCIYTCTGGLIADTAAGQRNLFLTANHCVNRSRIAGLVETFFEYTTSSCEGTCPGEPPPHTSGATLLATSKDGDFTLLELGGNPPAGSTFLGWNNAPIANSNGADLTRVSNPNYGPQVLSRHTVDTGSVTCNGLPRGEFIYSHDVYGATDGGSSGSPVVNSSGQIVGQLYGACGFNVGDPCAADENSTVDGALAYYYANVAEFLDPSGGGCSGDPECDDGDPCNGAETCVGGSCQGGSEPPCQNGDGCCPSGCDSGNDDDCAGGCVNPGGAPKGASCTGDIDCCSNKCKGKAGSKTCK